MKRKLNINLDIESIMHPKHPDCIINIPEKKLDEVLQKLEEMDKEILHKETEANQLLSEIRVLEHKKYDYLKDIFYGHIDSHIMAGGGLLMENHESSEDKRRQNEEARISQEARLDTLVHILQRNKRRIEEKNR